MKSRLSGRNLGRKRRFGRDREMVVKVGWSWIGRWKVRREVLATVNGTRVGGLAAGYVAGRCGIGVVSGPFS